MKISLLHPSRSRPEKSFNTIKKWIDNANEKNNIELIISLDWDDKTLSKYRELYQSLDFLPNWLIEGNSSCVQAINKAARMASGDIFIVVSDDTDCFPGWDTAILKEVEGKEDWILKTQDGIQNWIITMPVMDRIYYNRTGNIYDHDFEHMFCDTWLTVKADISGRKIKSNCLFPHLNDTIKDDLRVRSDATWGRGENVFIEKIKKTSGEDLKKIEDPGMTNWIRRKLSYPRY